MTRTFLIATTLAAVLTAPAVAKEQTLSGASEGETASVAAFTAQLTWLANQHQMRKLLAHRGYIVTSDLNRVDNGYWVGMALKDGEPVRVAVKMPPRQPAEPFTN